MANCFTSSLEQYVPAINCLWFAHHKQFWKWLFSVFDWQSLFSQTKHSCGTIITRYNIWKVAIKLIENRFLCYCPQWQNSPENICFERDFNCSKSRLLWVSCVNNSNYKVSLRNRSEQTLSLLSPALSCIKEGKVLIK